MWRMPLSPAIRPMVLTITQHQKNADPATDSQPLPLGLKSGIFSFMKEALWWHAEADGKVLCTHCSRVCRIGDGQAGFCYIRKNVGGKLYSLGYGASTGFAIDPIEKKPLNHFFPGTPVLSFGTAGCNLGCKFCQNWDISKARLDEKRSALKTPEEVVDLAVAHGCESIA